MALKLAYASDDGEDLLRTGLIGYFPLEEGEGPRLDASVFGNHLSQDGTSAVPDTTGKVGAASAAMTASSKHNLQRVQFALAGSWFIAGWVKLTNLGNSGYIFSRDGANNDASHWLRFDQPSGEMRAGVSTDGSDSTEVASPPPSVNNWSLMIYGWDDTAKAVFLSVDGSGLASEEVGADWNAAGSIDFCMGGRKPANPQNNMDMNADHVGVWAGVDLTDAHIVALYAGGDGVAVYGGR